MTKDEALALGYTVEKQSDSYQGGVFWIYVLCAPDGKQISSGEGHETEDEAWGDLPTE